MKSPHDLKPKSFALNMTPLIDVVFLLIVFFLVSNTMIREEAAMELDLPRAHTGKELTENETGKLIINVADESHLFLGTRPVKLDELRVELDRRRTESPIPLEVRIRTNRNVPYRVIEPILVVCAKSGIGNVSFAVVD